VSEDLILELGGNALQTTALLATPLLLSALVTGLVVSVFQAVTQINESTLTFIPKMVIVALVIMLAGPWMLDVLKTYTIDLMDNIHLYVRN